MEPERIWIRLPNWLGDTLMARPLLHRLARLRPGVELRACGPAPMLELLQPEPLFDASDAWEARERGRLRSRLRAWHPHTALVLPPSFSSAWFAFGLGAGRRIGFSAGGRDRLLTRHLRRAPRGDAHASAEYLALADGAWDFRESELPLLPVSEAARTGALELLVRHGISNPRLVVMAPGAIYGPAKRWSEARFVALARELIRGGSTVALCGTAAEAETGARAAAAIGAGSLSLMGATPLPVLAALCARAALAVSNDSGLAHLAGAVGAPTVVLFGSTSSAWTAPLGPRVRVVQHAPVCAPCFQRTCRIGYRCLESIEVAEVAARCREWLDRFPRAA